jgi:hypothetical protein
MILPCRIRQPATAIPSFAIVVLAPALLLSPFQASGQNVAASTVKEAGGNWLSASPIQVIVGVDAGYDDNVTLMSSPQGSSFTR